jgi:hypothetical protein
MELQIIDTMSPRGKEKQNSGPERTLSLSAELLVDF